MNLNLPYLQELEKCENILIAGVGGGFDVLCGLPLYFELQWRGKKVHLANYSFTDFAVAKKCSKPLELIPDMLMGTYPNITEDCNYYPEGYLSQWFMSEYLKEVPIWMFAKTGVVPLRESYARLIHDLNIDGLLLVDGGVDSLMNGNEQGAGTILEDTVSLAAVADFNMPKILACVGMTTEVEDRVCHYHVLQNMAQLMIQHESNFLGACAMTRNQPSFRAYANACRYVQDRDGHSISHISSRIVPAVNGNFGNYHAYPQDSVQDIFINPLMTLYWFFNANTVIHNNLLIESIKKTFTFTDVRIVFRQFLYANKSEPRKVQQVPYF